jgi:hypothetical protein
MTAYAVNKKIVADVFADETVLINVEKGLYFSMQGSATQIWQAFDTPQTVSAVLAALTSGLSPAQGEEVAGTVAVMIEHELLVEAEAPPAGGGTTLYSLAGAAYAVPVLSVFSDLAELIAIDPVHEVDEGAGWPVRPATFPGAT